MFLRHAPRSFVLRRRAARECAVLGYAVRRAGLRPNGSARCGDRRSDLPGNDAARPDVARNDATRSRARGLHAARSHGAPGLVPDRRANVAADGAGSAAHPRGGLPAHAAAEARDRHHRRLQTRPARCSLAAAGSAADDFAAGDPATSPPAAGLAVRALPASVPAGCARGCPLGAAALAGDCCGGGRRDVAASAAARSDRRRDRRSDHDRDRRANRKPAVRAPRVAAAEAFVAAVDLAAEDAPAPAVGVRPMVRPMVRPTSRSPTTTGPQRTSPQKTSLGKEAIRRRGGDRGRGLHDVACAADDHQMNCSGLAARVRWLSKQIYGERGVRRGGACSETSPTGCGIGFPTRQVKRKCAQARPAPPNSNLSPRRRPKQQP